MYSIILDTATHTLNDPLPNLILL